MTLQEWKRKFPLMNWEVFKESLEEKNYLERELDFDAPEGLADGVYEFDCYVRRKRDGTPKLFKGMVVKDGKFEPFATSWNIYKVVTTDYYDEPVQIGMNVNHKFIETIRWTGTYFEVGLGS